MLPAGLFWMYHGQLFRRGTKEELPTIQELPLLRGADRIANCRLYGWRVMLSLVASLS